jgi:hypothetical protein
MNMNISELLSAAILAATPLSLTITTTIAFVRAKWPELLSGPLVRIVSMIIGVVLAFGGWLSGASTPAPFDQLGLQGVPLLGILAGLLASGGVDFLRGVLPGSSIQLPSSLKIDDLPDDGFEPAQPQALLGPVIDHALIGFVGAAFKSFTGIDPAILVAIIKNVWAVTQDTTLAWSYLGQIISRVQAGESVEAASKAVLE